MTTRLPLPSLSEDTIGVLKTLKETDKEEFYAYVVALRKSGWPLRAISDPLGVSRTAVTGWERKYGIDRLLPVVEPLPEVKPKERKNGVRRYQLSAVEASELLRLNEEASKVRRFTDANAESRQSARVLESMLYTYREKGATLTQLAKACGVSRPAVAQRLRKLQD
jgi:lambda repressor-like predicted transcriptional regulator